MENKPTITGLSEEYLARMVNPEQHFKFSNFMEWLENEKSKRKDERIKMGLTILMITILIGAVIYTAQIGLINKDAMAGLLGTIGGVVLTIFTKFIQKPGKGE